MKNGLNHLFKILGILLLVMSFTVFANAATFNLNCSNPFSCGSTTYCASAANPSLLQHYSSNNYTVNSSTTGEHTCSATVRLTGFGNPNGTNQNNEITSVYLNGVKIGTTVDRYANTSDPSGTTFCGVDTQTIGPATLNLSSTNTVTISSEASHGVVSVVLNCTPTGYYDECEYNSTPRITNLVNRTIRYNSNFQIDLWNHINDADHRLSELEISATINNDLLDCEIQDNRYLVCDSLNYTGSSILTIRATDPCDDMASVDFTVNITNNPPVINVPDQERSCASNLNRFINLRNYSYDEELNLATFSLLSQSNTDLLNCRIDGGYYLTCDVNNCSESYSDLVILITDVLGLTNDTNFRINLTNSSPTASVIPDICINNSNSNIIDFKNYFSDLEDKNNLTYTLVDQNTNVNVDCRIPSLASNLSCELKTNAFTSNLLRIRATDSGAKSVEQTMILQTNCFDNPTGSGTFTFSAPQIGVCLEKCTSHTTQIEVENKTFEEKYFSFDLIYNNHLEVSLGKNNFWLSPGQKTFVPLNVRTCTNDNEFYEVEVRDYDNNMSLFFQYEIGTCNNFDGFRIDEYENKICKGDIGKISLDVFNTTSELKIINLISENQLLLPYFEKERIILNEYDKTTVDLIVNAKYAPLGKYNVFLEGAADNYLIKKRAVIEVVDCSEITERNLLIETADFCHVVEKGGRVDSSFTVRRLVEGCSICNFDKLGVDLSILGMPNELSFNTVYLEGNEQKIIDYTIYVPKNAAAGVHLLTVTGTELKQGVFDNTIGFVDQETICINVLGESKSELKLLTQQKDIIWCESEIFELEIKNTGDFDETFALSLHDLPIGVTAFLSETTINIKKGETKIIYVSIASNPESKIIDNQFITVKLNGAVNLSAKIYFNIKQKASFEDLEFLSATELLTIKTGENKIYELILRNNSNKTYKNVEIGFENLPVGVNIQNRLIDSIAPGQIVIVSGDVSFIDVNGEFKPAFVIKSFNYINKKEFRLILIDNKPFDMGFISGAGIGNNDNQGNLTGLFAFGGFNFGIGLGIFLLLVLLMFVLLVFFTSEQNKEEVWMEG